MRTRMIVCAIAGAAALAVPTAAQAANTNIPLLGLSKSAAGPGTATASPAAIPGVLALSTSSATPSGASWDAVTVAGIVVYGKQNNGGADTYKGLLAPLGGTIDKVNAALCPNGINGQYCINVLGTDGAQAQCDTVAFKFNCTHGVILGAAANNQAEGIGIGNSAAAAATPGAECSGAKAWLIGVKANGNTYTVDGTGATHPC